MDGMSTRITGSGRGRGIERWKTITPHAHLRLSFRIMFLENIIQGRIMVRRLTLRLAVAVGRELEEVLWISWGSDLSIRQCSRMIIPYCRWAQARRRRSPPRCLWRRSCRVRDIRDTHRIRVSSMHMSRLERNSSHDRCEAQLTPHRRNSNSSSISIIRKTTINSMPIHIVRTQTTTTPMRFTKTSIMTVIVLTNDQMRRYLPLPIARPTRHRHLRSRTYPGIGTTINIRPIITEPGITITTTTLTAFIIPTTATRPAARHLAQLHPRARPIPSLLTMSDGTYFEMVVHKGMEQVRRRRLIYRRSKSNSLNNGLYMLRITKGT